MKLADWLNLPNDDGTRKLRRAFAAAIGVTPTMITNYVSGEDKPGKDVLERIVIETKGAVTPNDFLSDEARRVIAEAAQ